MVTLVELKARAKKMGYKGYSKMKKGELEKLLTTPPPKPPRTKPVSQRVPIKQVIPKTELYDTYLISGGGDNSGMRQLDGGIKDYIMDFMKVKANKDKYKALLEKKEKKKGSIYKSFSLPKITIENKVKGENFDIKLKNVSGYYNSNHDIVEVSYELPDKIASLKEALSISPNKFLPSILLKYPNPNNPNIKKFGKGLVIVPNEAAIKKYKLENP
jgi:hypothetical protein